MIYQYCTNIVKRNYSLATLRSKRVNLLSTGKIINIIITYYYISGPPSPTSLNKDTKQDVNVELYCLHDPGDESNTIACLKGARAIIKQTLQLYSLDELSISFNGHKDCTGLLCLFHAAMNKLSLPAQELKALYFLYKSQFPQAEGFVSETTRRYNLNLIT